MTARWYPPTIDGMSTLEGDIRRRDSWRQQKPRFAEVAVAFTSNPQLSRPDIVTLRDDRHMISPDHIVPVVRTSLLERYGPALRRRLDAVSRLLTTLQLRGLNQQVIDGRLPEAVGGEFVDSNALGGVPAHPRPGPRIVVGFQDFAENETLAYMYARRCAAPASA
jgi:glycine betaine/choline ABC-type transport system substrate-binding protein